MLSIITPSFNSEKYIAQTYAGIISQTFTDWEWMIVDDGSTDNTLQLLQQYAAADSRIKYLKRDREPKGATTCRNIAVEKCSGEYLLFLDTDDVPASFCLAQRVNAMQLHPNYDFIVFQMMLFQEKLDDTKLLWNVEDERDNLDRSIRMNPVMAGSSTVWKKDSFVKIGLWDDRILINQDIELHIRSMAYGLRFLMQLDLPPDIFVRNNQQSISRAKKKPADKQLSRVYYFSKITEHLKKNGLLEKHTAAVKWLFLKLFFDLLYDQEPAIAGQLYNVAISEIKLNAKENIICKGLLLLGKHSKPAVGLIRFINRKLLSSSANVNQTHGRLVYDKPVVY